MSYLCLLVLFLSQIRLSSILDSYFYFSVRQFYSSSLFLCPSSFLKSFQQNCIDPKFSDLIFFFLVCLFCFLFCLIKSLYWYFHRQFTHFCFVKHKEEKEILIMHSFRLLICRWSGMLFLSGIDFSNLASSPPLTPYIGQLPLPFELTFYPATYNILLLHLSLLLLEVIISMILL